MKSIDIRFDGATIQILQSLIGQQLDEINMIRIFKCHRYTLPQYSEKIRHIPANYYFYA